ncbi:hypothetical protein AERO9AM_50050 [Aeromicrobium sp. 9AM]|nr:hypothetical protein AERO9AM_50050 [Aeromicrobium sp. 9AM]
MNLRSRFGRPTGRAEAKVPRGYTALRLNILARDHVGKCSDLEA